MKNLLGIVIFLGMLYGMYWVFKTVSYEIFYESMIKQTIQEELKNHKVLHNIDKNTIEINKIKGL